MKSRRLAENSGKRQPEDKQAAAASSRSCLFAYITLEVIYIKILEITSEVIRF
jgi:hypothetical protein